MSGLTFLFKPTLLRFFLVVWWGSPLPWSINMRCGARGRLMLYMPPRETLAATSTWPNSEALAERVMLAHSRTVFHLYTCGLRRGTAVVAIALIGYTDMKVSTRTTTRSWSWETTSSTPMRDYVGSLLWLFFCCSVHLVVMIHDLLLASILGWYSANVAYPFPL
jgi:hypothetical protein